MREISIIVPLNVVSMSVKKDMHRCIKKEKHRKRQNEWRKRKKNKKEKHMGELASFNDEAKHMGLTYGQYMIFLQTEKDQKERAKIS